MADCISKSGNWRVGFGGYPEKSIDFPRSEFNFSLPVAMRLMVKLYMCYRTGDKAARLSRPD